MRFRDVQNGQFFMDEATNHLYRKTAVKGSTSAIDVTSGVVMGMEALNPVKLVDATFESFDSLLTPKEKNYLELVLAPFQEKVEFIVKIGVPNSGKVHIGVAFNDDTCMSFPAFDPAEPLYEGMETGEKYTAEMLGLWQPAKETTHANWELPAFVQ